MKYSILAIFLLCNSLLAGPCMNTSKIVQTLINIPALDKYFHPELESRVPLYIINNKYIGEDINLIKYGERIKIVEDTVGTKGNYIEVTQLEKINNKTKVSIYYKIQNIDVTGTIKGINDSCQVVDYQISQF